LENKVINATKFQSKLEESLGDYCKKLEDAPSWDDPIWEMLRKKIDAVCKNCGV
jgi:hypothetical protein